MSELAKQLREWREKATPGEWVAYNPDDSFSMNMYCVASRKAGEPEDENDLKNVIAVTLLQSGVDISCNDALWDANADFIAFCGTHALEIAAALDEREREVAELRQAITDIRDAVLNERHQMAEEGFTSEQVNAVLGIIDDATAALSEVKQ